MEIDFTSIDTNFSDYEEKFIKLTEIALNHLKLTFNPIISVSLINNKQIHKINKKYRQIDQPTDVISFAFMDGDDLKEKVFHSTQTVCLGDIYISIEKADEQAKEYGHSIERELSFLYVHGLLHLLGYDHMKKEDEEIMFPLQEEILSVR